MGLAERVRRDLRRAMAVIVGAIPVGAAAFVAVAHRNPGQYLQLRRFTDPDTALGVLAVALCAAPVILLVLRRERYLPAALVGTVPILVGTVLAAAVPDPGPFYTERQPFVHGTRSADGRFSLIGATYVSGYDSESPWFVGFRVRRGNGLLAQQSERHIAEFWSDGPVGLATIGFGAPGTVEVVTTDGRRWTIAFDRRDAVPAHTLAFTDDAPGGVRRT